MQAKQFFYVHMHLIPRRTGDIDNPKGGISQEKIDALIDNIRENKLHIDKGHKFSSHHYELY